jgi:hypothetical protein
MKQSQTPIILKVILMRGLVVLLAAILSLMPSLPVPEKAQAIGPLRLPMADGADGNLPLTFGTGARVRASHLAGDESKDHSSRGALQLAGQSVTSV